MKIPEKNKINLKYKSIVSKNKIGEREKNKKSVEKE